MFENCQKPILRMSVQSTWSYRKVLISSILCTFEVLFFSRLCTPAIHGILPHFIKSVFCSADLNVFVVALPMLLSS